MDKDFSFQYFELIDLLLNRYIESMKSNHNGCFDLHGCSIETALKKYIFHQPAFNKSYLERYNKLREEHISEDIIKEDFYNLLFNEYAFIDAKREEQEENENANRDDGLYEKKLLQNTVKYRNRIFFYSFNFRFLQIALPVLSKIQEEVIILTPTDIPDEFECEENITAIQFKVIRTNEDSNYFLKFRFNWFYYMFNNLELMVRSLAPKVIIVLEGVHPEFEMLAVIGRKLNIPTVCLQQGWPGLMHSRFRGMQYDKFLSWGNNFSQLLKPFNPIPQFINAGYPHKINLCQDSERNAITFFFQGPFFIANELSLEQMTLFANYCSLIFPNHQVLIREHPEYHLPHKLKNHFCHDNIQFVPSNKYDLSYVLQKSLISVSIFSSTIMESIAYGSIPFIFNLTSMPRYFPDLEREELGIEVHSLEEAKSQIRKLFSNQPLIKKLQENIAISRSYYFTTSGDEAINNIIKEIIV